MSHQADEALELFRSGFICSQSVLAAFSEEYGVTKDIALRLANGFGGGIARRQDICGAVSGAIMVIGLKYGRTRPDDKASHEKTYRLVDEFCREFMEKNKSITCREILGCDMNAAREKGLFKSLCPRLVGDAAEILGRILTEA